MCKVSDLRGSVRRKWHSRASAQLQTGRRGREGREGRWGMLLGACGAEWWASKRWKEALCWFGPSRPPTEGARTKGSVPRTQIQSPVMQKSWDRLSGWLTNRDPPTTRNSSSALIFTVHQISVWNLANSLENVRAFFLKPRSGFFCFDHLDLMCLNYITKCFQWLPWYWQWQLVYFMFIIRHKIEKYSPEKSI